MKGGENNMAKKVIIGIVGVLVLLAAACCVTITMDRLPEGED